MPSRMQLRWSPMVLSVALIAVLAPLAGAQQKNDEEYTRKIKEYLQDPRITTELVDHLPASSTVPTPLKFNGRVVGMPVAGNVDAAADPHGGLALHIVKELEQAADTAGAANNAAVQAHRHHLGIGTSG